MYAVALDQDLIRNEAVGNSLGHQYVPLLVHVNHHQTSPSSAVAVLAHGHYIYSLVRNQKSDYYSEQLGRRVFPPLIHRYLIRCLSFQRTGPVSFL
jgi:hypothetical protein